MKCKNSCEILSRTRDIEENPFSRHCNRQFRQFQNLLGIAINKKNQKISPLRPKKIWKDGDFRHIFVFISQKKIFLSNRTRYLGIANTHPLGKKSEKTKDERNLEKMAKNRFFQHISSIFVRKFFFRKSGSVAFWALPFLHLCAKNKQKLISQSREKLVTDERTDGQWLIYRTSRQVQKSKLFVRRFAHARRSAQWE